MKKKTLLIREGDMRLWFEKLEDVFHCQIVRINVNISE